MGIRTLARNAEYAAATLAQKGRGVLGHRENHAGKVIGTFVNDAMNQPPGGTLPDDVREDLRLIIERTISALETHVARAGDRSQRRAMRDTGVVQQIYALREAQQHLLQTRHFIY
jgi:hypothetical protein